MSCPNERIGTKLFALMATVMLLTGGAATAQANLITNGGFDDYTNDTTDTGTSSGNIEGGDLIKDLEPVSWGTIPAGGEGPDLRDNVLGLDHHSAQYYARFKNEGGTEGGAGLYQTISTNAGTGYTLSFYLARNTANGPPSVDIDVFDGTGGTDASGSGGLLDETVTAGQSGVDTWEASTFEFTADSDTTTVRFFEPNGGPENVDPNIDTVSVTVVPEPGSLALLAPAGLLALRRRRR